jgi:hypothetical protein
LGLFEEGPNLSSFGPTYLTLPALLDLYRISIQPNFLESICQIFLKS